MYCSTALRDQKVSLTRKRFRIFFFWQMHAKMEVCNQFCPCYFYYSNLLSMPNTGADEKMFDSTTAAGSSSHPFELLTVSQSCLLAADPNQNWLVCVADLPKDKAVAIMSSLINAFLKTKSNQVPNPFSVYRCHTFPERYFPECDGMFTAEPLDFYFILFALSIFLRLLYKQSLFHCGPLKASIFSKSQHTLRPTVQAASFPSLFLPSCSTTQFSCSTWDS